MAIEYLKKAAKTGGARTHRRPAAGEIFPQGILCHMTTEIRRGLKDVYFERSRVCFIDGRAGELRYRGYSIHDLAERSTFEETCYLLFHGELPTRDQLQRFTSELKAARRLPAEVLELLK